MSEVLALLAPAKLNLGLRVVGRRDDGFHLLETIFVGIDLCDEVRAARRRAPGVGFRMIGARAGGLPVAAGEDNLVVRAARAFLARSGVQGGFDVVLRKTIPAGGGLGGGSADAAAMLCLAQSLCGAPLSIEVLAELALGLGADVPFFVRGPFCDAVTCFARGIGEQLWPMPVQPPRHFVLVLPPFGTPTASVFKALANRLTETQRKAKVPVTEAPTPSEFAVIESGGNELEEPAMLCTPGLRALRDVLADALSERSSKGRARSARSPIRMTGSGSTLFVERTRADDADRVAERLRATLARDVETPPGSDGGRADADPGGDVRILRADALRAPLRPVPCAWRDDELPD